MKQAIVGALEVDEVVSFLSELIDALVRLRTSRTYDPISVCVCPHLFSPELEVNSYQTKIDSDRARQ